MPGFAQGDKELEPIGIGIMQAPGAGIRVPPTPTDGPERGDDNGVVKKTDGKRVVGLLGNDHDISIGADPPNCPKKGHSYSGE